MAVRAARSEPAVRRFHGADEILTIAGRVLQRPLTYISGTKRNIDASTIVTSLRVGNPEWAPPLPYWPSYAEADPDQRARYLDWMAGGRVDPDIAIGYVFIFFYGLEWRALVERADIDLVYGEVRRLFDIYARCSGSLESYASSFMAFTALRQLETMDEEALEGRLAWLIGETELATAGVLAWHLQRERPLTAQHALRIAWSSEEAKRGVVVKRAADELARLFEIRYRDRFGDGVVFKPSKRLARCNYRPASATILHGQFHFDVRVAQTTPRQLAPLVDIWNDCVDDLRKASTLKGKSAGVLTADAWAALPPELRSQYEHPDRDRWEAVVAEAPKVDGYHVLTAGDLAQLVGIPVDEASGGKLTAAQLRRVVETAADLDYAVEPDARAHRKGGRSSDVMLIWSARDTSCPDPGIYGSIYALSALVTTVAMADGVLLEDEIRVMTAMLSDLFALDDGARTRLVALLHVLSRTPARGTTLAKKLRTARTGTELAKIGRVLVAVAAVDGEIAEAEHQALRSLYKALGLSATDLAAAVAGSGARLASDEVVVVRPASSAGQGETIPQPESAQPRVELDHDAIAAILADTREVALMLADVLDQDDDEPPATPVPPAASPTRTHSPASRGGAALADALDTRYHAVLEELLAQRRWSPDEVRALGRRHSLMPGAILETINSWSDDALGDFLIDEQGDWHIQTNLVSKEDA